MSPEAQGSWQPDPYGGASWRWWDGAAWGSDTGAAYPDAGFAPIRSAIGGRLVLGRAAAAIEGDLMLGDQRVARIYRPGPGTGEAHCSEGSWQFEGNAMTSERRTVRVLPSGLEIARFEWGHGGFLAFPGSNGMLTFTDGRRVPFPRTADVQGRSGALMDDLRAMASADWTVMGPRNNPILRAQFGLAPRDGVHHVGASELWVDVFPDAAQVIEYPLLVMLATFLAWTIASSNEARHRLNQQQGI